ncbi:hypothetical protein SASPL_121528 [Salvia splendens]|uniref:Uncharacterized protein n=1 Tax=Salvia splendens TaxID=180675 RepID=A0A8X8XXG8_SALSN|nr:hypothetical protein SASPL_121528 [Salvia splendens]
MMNKISIAAFVLKKCEMRKKTKAKLQIKAKQSLVLNNRLFSLTYTQSDDRLMESAPSTCFLRRGLVGAGLKSPRVRLFSSSWQRWYPTSCKISQRHFSLQNKRQQAKKINLPTNTSFKPIDDSKIDTSHTRKGDALPINTSFETNIGSSLPKGSNSGSDQETDSNNNVPVIEYEYLEGGGYISSSQPHEVRSLHIDTIGYSEGSVHLNGENTSSSFLSNDIPVCTPWFILHLAFFFMISASYTYLWESKKGSCLQFITEKNSDINLLNEARIRALEDLEKFLSEKKSLQGEINNLEMKLAETVARLKVATEEKIHVELLEENLNWT